MASSTPIEVPDDGKSKLLVGRVAAFGLHTVVVYTSAVHLSPWLVFHWFGWVAPILQISISVPATDWYLQHLEIVTIVPAVVLSPQCDQVFPYHNPQLHRRGSLRFGCRVGVERSRPGSRLQDVAIPCALIRPIRYFNVRHQVLPGYSEGHADHQQSLCQRPGTSVGTDDSYCAFLCRRCVQFGRSGVETSASDQTLCFRKARRANDRARVHAEPVTCLFDAVVVFPSVPPRPLRTKITMCCESTSSSAQTMTPRSLSPYLPRPQSSS